MPLCTLFVTAKERTKIKGKNASRHPQTKVKIKGRELVLPIKHQPSETVLEPAKESFSQPNGRTAPYSRREACVSCPLPRHLLLQVQVVPQVFLHLFVCVPLWKEVTFYSQRSLWKCKVVCWHLYFKNKRRKMTDAFKGHVLSTRL